jgi:hypothetical protein
MLVFAFSKTKVAPKNITKLNCHRREFWLGFVCWVCEVGICQWQDKVLILTKPKISSKEG